MTQTAPTRVADSPSGPGATAALEALARAARQVALYGPEHRIGAQAMDDACAELGAVAEGGTLRIEAREEALLWDGEMVALQNGNAARLNAAMRERLIGGVEIDPGAQPEELARLLWLLSEDLTDPVAREAAFLEMEAEGRGNIRVEGLDFSKSVLASQAAWQELRRTMEADESGALRNLISLCLRSLKRLADRGAVERVETLLPAACEGGGGRTPEQVAAEAALRIVQEAGEAVHAAEGEYWPEWCAEVGRQVEELTPAIRSSIFRTPCSVSTGRPDMLAMIARELSPTQCVSAVLDHPDSIRVERSEGLRLALARVMTDSERGRAVESLLHSQAAERGVPEEVYQNVVGVLMSESVRTAEEGPSARGADRTGSRTEGVCPGLDDLVCTTREEMVSGARASMLVDVLNAADSVKQFGIALTLLVREVEECARRGETGSAVRMLSAMEEIAGKNGHPDAAWRSLAARSLGKCESDEVVACVCEAFRDASEEERSEIAGLLARMGDGGMGGLVGIARQAEGAELAAALSAIVGAGTNGLGHLRRMVAQAGTETVGAVLRHLVGRNEGCALEQLAAVADQVGETGRMELIGLIRERGEAEMGEVLVGMLGEGSMAVRLAATEALGALGVRAAVPALCEVVTGQSGFGTGARLKETAARALESIGDERAIPALCGELRDSFSCLFGSAGPKIAAAEALGEMGGPEARAALERGAKRLRPAVRAACRRALERLGSTSGASAAETIDGS